MNSKTEKRERFLVIFIIISLFFENVRLFSLFGGVIKVSHVAMILAILYGFFCFSHTVKTYIGLLFFLVLPLIPLYRINNIGGFLGSYVNYAIIVLFVCFALRITQKAFCRDVVFYLSFYNVIVSIAAVLAIIQFIMMNLFGVFWLDGFWGSFQFHHSSYGMEMGFYRAYAVFHEPSYLGFVCNLGIAINLAVPATMYKNSKRRMFFIALYVISVFCTVSASALLVMAVLFAVYCVFSPKPQKKTLIIITLFILTMIIIFLVIAILDIDVPVLDMLFERLFQESGREGTSAYERLRSPVEYVKKTFTYYPFFGRGIGQEGNVDAVGTIGRFKGIHNSLYGIVVTFGLSSVVFAVWFIKEFFTAKFKGKYFGTRVILFLSLIGMYMSTGSYMSGDTFILVIIVLLFLASLASDSTAKEGVLN